MNMGNSLVVIGDVHGRRQWKEIVERHPKDRILFLGDYCDPYDPGLSEGAVSNLEEIIRLKSREPDRIVLLLGNHDMHYLDRYFPKGTRYDEVQAPQLKRIFAANRALFCYAHEERGYLFTHAGISRKWWKRLRSLSPGVDACSVAECLNAASGKTMSAMRWVGSERGGTKPCSGPFWADLEETCAPVAGLHQVVGHSRVDWISEVSDGEGSIIYCDALEEGEYLTIGEDNMPEVMNIN